VRGKILDAVTGAPVRSASVEVDAGGSGSSQTYSAADGTYVFLGLSPGTYTVTAGKDDYAGNSRSVVVVAGQTTLGQDITLTQTEFQGVRGHVFYDNGGTASGGASIDLVTVGTEFGRGFAYSSFADGSYEIQGVAPGDYWLKASDAYCFTETIAVTVVGGQILEQDLYLVHHKAQGVIGRVVDSVSRDPVVDALVTVGSGLSGGMFEGQAYTGAGGSFSFTGLEAGWHNVTVDKPGYIVHEQAFQIKATTLGSAGLRHSPPRRTVPSSSGSGRACSASWTTTTRSPRSAGSTPTGTVGARSRTDRP
jgi:protocatechuate 3,4-dioxygenase beta subunit